MAKNDSVVTSFGEIIEALGNSRFTVSLDNGVILNNCTISGKIRKNFIRLLPGDRVRIALSVYDLTTGRIEERLWVAGQQPQNPENQAKKKKGKGKK